MTYNGDVLIIKSAYSKLHLDFPITAVEVKGIGMPPPRNRITQAPFQHGATYLGMCFDPRSIELTVSPRGCSHNDWWIKRQLLFNLLSPLSGELWFKVVRPDGYVFTLQRLAFDGGLESGVGRGSAIRTMESFKLTAYDPIWYGTEEELSVVEASSPYLANELSFPAEFPIEFGIDHFIDPTVTYSISVLGNWYVYPLITMTGPLENPGLRSVTLGRVLQLAYTVAAGEVVTITTDIFNRGVVSSTAGDLSGYLTAESTLDIYLIPDIYNGLGPNQFNFVAMDTDANSEIKLTWNPAYVGI